MPGLFRVQLPVLFVVIISFTTYAFASSATNGSARGGEGAQQISGWVVSNVQYRLADGSGTLSAVEFDLDKSADVVKISLDSSNALYFDCMNLQGFHWVCNVSSRVGISSMDELRVVAVGME